MTNLDDFDRSLSEFLADGPSTAPEAPVIAAMAHARTTPRRPDPLRFLRPDVMAPRRSALARPGLVLAVGALAIAGVGAAVIGSRPSDSVVPPGPTPSPSIAGPRPTFAADVPLIVASGNPFTLTVRDTTGELVGAVSGQPGDGGSVTGVAVTADPADPHVLVVTWVDLTCEMRGTMTVDEDARAISILRENCLGDAIGQDHVVRLTFATEMDPAAWHGDVITSPEQTDVPHQSFGAGEPVPSGSPAPVAFSFELTDGVGGPTLLDVADASGHLANAVSGPLVDPAKVAIVSALNVDARSVRVAWQGFACDAIARLTIAADFGLTIERPTCDSDTTLVYRSTILTFDRDVNADAFDTAMSDFDSGSAFPWAVDGADSAGNRYNLRVADPIGALLNVATMDPGTARPSGADRVRLDQAGAALIEVVWLARACDASPILSIDTSGSHWLLTDSACSGDVADVARRVSLTFTGPRPVESTVVTVVATSP
jgi:hypothetical protein